MRAVVFLVIASLYMLSACSTGGGSSDLTPAQLSPTIYYRPVINVEKDSCSSNNLHDMRDRTGALLVTLCESSYKKCFMEGSCLVLVHGKQKSIGYGGKRNGVATFEEITGQECPYGRGVKDICLDPYFTVAADLNIYKAGDVIYVPKLHGVKLPSGETHDGYLVIRDEGGGIKGAARFDFFTGYLNYTDHRNVMAQLGFGDPNSRIDFQLASPEVAQRVRQQRQYPNMPRFRSAANQEAIQSQ